MVNAWFIISCADSVGPRNASQLTLANHSIKSFIGRKTEMKEMIRAKVLSKQWTFTEISNLKTTIDDLCSELYSEMTFVDRFQLIREIRINEVFVGQTYEDSMREAVKITLSGEIAETIRSMLGEATVNFGGNTNEISEGSLGGEPHQKRPANEKKSSVLKE